MTSASMGNLSRIFWASLVFLFLASTFVGVPLVLYTYRSVFSYIAAALALVCVYFLWGKIRFLSRAKPVEFDEKRLILPRKFKYISVSCFLILAVSGFLILWFVNPSPSKHFLSPWSVIPLSYVFVFAISAFIMWIFAFSNLNKRWFLTLVVIFMALQHAYLPFVYKQGFGGDRLRHLAIEQYLKKGNIYSPSLFGEDVRYLNIGPVKVPEVFVVGNKTSYAPQWGLTLMVNEFIGVDLKGIDKWMVPIIWVVFIPILIYLIAVKIFSSELFARLACVGISIFYPLQVFGATTVPVSFYFPFFLGICYLWILYLGDEIKGKGVLFPVLFTLISYWGYILYFLILVIMGVLVIAKKYLSKAYFYLAALLGMILLPLLEVMQDGSVAKKYSSVFDFFVGIPADIFGRFSGLVAYFASPTHIDQGNFILNQTGRTIADLPILAWRIWPIVISSGILFLTFWYSKNKRLRKIYVFLGIILANYFLSWYFLNGSHILARRLDQVIALLIVFIISYALKDFYANGKVFSAVRRALLISLVLSGVTIITYTSGPVLDQVTEDEFLQAKVAWAKLQKIGPPYCAIGSTWPLLALEYESETKVVGGGFPVYKEYAQPERVKIFERLTQRPDKKYFDWAKRITDADKCLYLTEERFISETVLRQTKALISEPKKFGVTYIFDF